MSVAGGPKLAGIGRSGDSDIVLCLDTRDAASYPGEPTLIILYTQQMGILLAGGGTDQINQGLPRAPPMYTTLLYNIMIIQPFYGRRGTALIVI